MEATLAVLSKLQILAELVFFHSLINEDNKNYEHMKHAVFVLNLRVASNKLCISRTISMTIPVFTELGLRAIILLLGDTENLYSSFTRYKLQLSVSFLMYSHLVYY